MDSTPHPGPLPDRGGEGESITVNPRSSAVKKEPPRLPGAALVFTDGQPLPGRGSRLAGGAGAALAAGLAFSDFLVRPSACHSLESPPNCALTCSFTPRMALWKSPFGSGGVEGGLLLGFRVPLGGQRRCVECLRRRAGCQCRAVECDRRRLEADLPGAEVEAGGAGAAGGRNGYLS